MSLPVSLFIGLRYGRSRNRTGFVSFITFFSITGIFLGIASLITVVSVMNGLEGELKKRILGIVPHVMISAESNQPIENWQNLRQEFLKVVEVEQATPVVSSEAMVQSSTGLRGVLMQGVDIALEKQNIVANNMILGNFSQLAEKPFSVVLGQTLANELRVIVGDKIRLILPNQTRFTPMGRMPVQRTFEVVGIFDLGSQLDDSVIYTDLSASAKLLRLPNGAINEIRLYLSDAFNAEKVLEYLPALPDGLTAVSWQKSQGSLFSAVSMEKHMMWLMLSLIVAVAAFNIVSALVMVVIDKQGEIGILQTLGLSRQGIVQIFITQGMFNGIVGSFLGAALGLLLTFNLNELLDLLGVNLLGGPYGKQQLPIDFRLEDLSIIIIGALLMTFFASLYPAFKASKTEPAEVLRNE